MSCNIDLSLKYRSRISYSDSQQILFVTDMLKLKIKVLFEFQKFCVINLILN